MLHLALLRHAKSSWDNPGLDDFDRPLNDRGRQAAPVMGQILASLRFTPDIILCSPSCRTRETLARIAPAFGPAAPSTMFDDALYLASAADIAARIRKVTPADARVLVIGHNPGLHTLAARLARSGDAGLIARVKDKFPTAALATYSFPQANWGQWQPETGHLETFITPKDRA
jgi:phosphohistidine phosphatase